MSMPRCSLKIAVSSLLVVSLMASFNLQWSSSGARAATASAPAEGDQFKPLYAEFVQLFHEFYPKAKNSITGTRIRFEYKAHPHISLYSHREELAPDSGGILAELELKSGEYKGSEQLPKEQNQYLYNEIIMAPASKQKGCYLQTRLCYPPDTPTDFLDRFKDLVQHFDKFVPASSQTLAGTETKPAENTAADKVPVLDNSARKPAQSAEPAKKHKLFLWKATRGNDVVYLAGTIHAASPDIYPLPSELDDAFNRSRLLIVEIAIDRRPIDPAKIEELVKRRGEYVAPDRLSKHMSPQTKSIFNDYLTWAGESWAMYEQYKPWYVQELISASMPRRGDLDKLSRRLGLDRYFLAKAKAAKKPVSELETVDFQLQLSSNLSENVQDKLLQVTLLDFKDEQSMMKDIFAAWRAGDEQKMEDTAKRVAKEKPELEPFIKILLDDRNVAMVATLEQIMRSKPGPYFVAVGSAHLVGEKGLPALLRQKGFTIEQVCAAEH